jgi:hypothetical protein
MSRTVVLGMLAIIACVLLAALVLAISQLNYTMLLALKAQGAEHLGPRISMFEQPSVDMELLAASTGAFPSNIPAILKLATLLAGVALIAATQRQLTAMKNLLEGSTSKSKGHAGA